MSDVGPRALDEPPAARIAVPLDPARLVGLLRGAVSSYVARVDVPGRELSVSAWIVEAAVRRALARVDGIGPVEVTVRGDRVQLVLGLPHGLTAVVDVVPLALELSSLEIGARARLAGGVRLRHRWTLVTWTLAALEAAFGLARRRLAAIDGVVLDGETLRWSRPLRLGPLPMALGQLGVDLGRPRVVPLAFQAGWLRVDLSDVVPADLASTAEALLARFGGETAGG